MLWFANDCKSSSNTRELVTDKASCSIGYGAKKNRDDSGRQISTTTTRNDGNSKEAL